MDRRFYQIALSWNSLVGPKRYRRIREHFSELSDFFALSVKEQMEFCGVRNSENEAAFRRMPEEASRIEQKLSKDHILFITEDDPEYPARLKTIPDPPFAFYLKGHLAPSLPAVGVVGTRDVSNDAAAVNAYFARELSSFGIAIVSGMAKGHDGIAQNAALECDGYTLGVLGCGIDQVFPAENRGLFERVIAKGGLISEYPPGYPYLKANFPLRNRLISGLSDAVLLIQAPVKSGALLTAGFAAEQHRDLWVIPGSPGDPRNAGSNQLLAMGAKIAISPQEMAADILGKKPVKQVKGPEIELSPDEAVMLRLLKDELHADELADRLKWPTQKVYSILTILEIKGLAYQFPGGFFASSRPV